MSSVNQILNLLTSPEEPASQVQTNTGAVPGKGNSNGNSFGNIMSQLSAQNGQQNAQEATSNGNSQANFKTVANGKTQLSQAVQPAQGTPANGGLNGSIVSATETSVAVTESLRVNTPNQLAQAEQALVSLAEGLARMLNALSQMQAGNAQQARNVLSIIGGGNAGMAGLQNLVNAVQALEKGMEPGQNPLNLSAGQQGSLLAQMFQQMIQNQQILLGGPAASNNNGAAVAGVGAANGTIPAGDAVLQFAFSDLNLTQTQQTGAQNSNIFINLQNFQMSATFIQSGTNGVGAQNANGAGLPATATTFQPLAPSQSLYNALNQAVQNVEAQNLPAGAVAPVGQNTPAEVQGGLNQNLRDLAQLLMQSGVTQAALTTFMNQQNGNVGGGATANAALDQVAKSLSPAVEVPPPTKVESTALSTDANGNATAPLPGQFIPAESSTQSSVAVGVQTATLAGEIGSAPAVQTPAAGVFEVQPDIPIVGTTELNAINQTIAQATLLSHNNTTQANQQVNSAVPPTSVDELLTQLQNISASTVSNQNAVNETAGILAQASNVRNNAPLTNTALVTPAALTAPASALTTPATPQPIPTNTVSISQPGPLNPVTATLQQVTPRAINAQIQTASGAAVTSPASAVSPAAPPPATPPAVSTAPNISASAVTGEAIKNEVVLPNPTHSDLNNPAAITSAQFDVSAKPLTAEAVSSANPTPAVTTNLGISDSLDKMTPNETLISQAAVPALQTIGTGPSDKSDTVQGGVQANNQAPNGNIESAEILNQITQQVAAQVETARTVSRLNFQLIPESLGRVTVQLALVDQSVSARIIVTNPDVREAIQTHLVDLQSALNQAGLQIDQLQVQVQGGYSNLLAQYYQYQQEGSGYRLPVSFEASEAPQTPENSGFSEPLSGRTLVNLLV